MNYLGLDRPARPHRRAPAAEPVQAAGQIADLGGGALMAAFGIMAALRERDGAPARGERPARPGSGEGQVVDVSMADGALSWLAMVAGGVLRRRRRSPPRRAAAGRLADLLPAVRVRRRLGHARRAGAEVLAGVLSRRRPRGSDRAPVRAPRLRGPRRGRRRSSARARAPSGRSSRARTTAAWSPSSTSTRRCTPSSCARARWSSRSTSPAPRAPVRQLGIPVKLDAHARLARAAARPRAGRAHRAGPARGRLRPRAGRRAAGRGAAAGPDEPAAGDVPGVSGAGDRGRVPRRPQRPPVRGGAPESSC